MKDEASGEFHVPSFDGNRNVTRLIKYSDRSVSAEYEYAPFGSVLRATGPMALANPVRFSSEYHDEVTGLVYYGYRYYSPETHRWLSKDPIGYRGGPNLYGFVFNDPINQRDVYGLGLLSFICGQGWSGEGADAFEESIGESMMEQWDEMADGARVIGDDGVGGARNLMVDEMSDRYADMMLNYGEADMYIIAANDLTGGTMFMEGANGIDLQTQEELSDLESTQRMLMGGGQMLLNTAGAGAAIDSARAGYTGIGLPRFPSRAPRTPKPVGEPEVKPPNAQPSGTPKPAADDCPPPRTLTDAEKKLYDRVSPNKGLKEEVWERSKAPDGNVYDPNGRILNPDERWELGHKPEHKFSQDQLRAAEEGWTREEWIRYQNDPDIYRPELPSSNSSHDWEFNSNGDPFWWRID